MIGFGVSVIVFIILFKDIRELVRTRSDYLHRGLNHSNIKILLQYFFLVLGVLLVSGAFGIPFYLMTYLLIFSLIGFSLLVSWMIKFNRNLHDFNEFILILSHLSAQFKSSFKILASLEEVLLVVDESHQGIVKGLISDSFEGRDMVVSFASLSDHYLLHSMVSMMVHAEAFGDDEIERGLSLLERDVDALHEDVYDFVSEMHNFRRKLILLCVIGVGIALVSRNMLRMVVELELSSYYHNTAFVFLLTMILVVIFAHRIFRHSLLMEEESLK